MLDAGWGVVKMLGGLFSKPRANGVAELAALPRGPGGGPPLLAALYSDCSVRVWDLRRGSRLLAEALAVPQDGLRPAALCAVCANDAGGWLFVQLARSDGAEDARQTHALQLSHVSFILATSTAAKRSLAQGASATAQS